MKIVANTIVAWLKKKLEESRARGFVVGMSGGVDSSVVSILARKATKNTTGLILPCHSKKGDTKHAKLLAERFKIKYEKIELDNIYDLLIKTLPKGDKISRGNLKARLRMLILYYFANKRNYMVLGTGNKSELLQGYFTKYGDGGVDLLPIGDLYKTQVIELAKYLGVPDEIINKEPSAGLWRSQTDKKELGIEYKKLDELLYELYDKKTKTKEIARNIKIPMSKITEAVERYQKGKHKRLPPPVAKVKGFSS